MLYTHMQYCFVRVKVEIVDLLTGMGYLEKTAAEALKQANNDINLALQVSVCVCVCVCVFVCLFVCLHTHTSATCNQCFYYNFA